MVRTYSELQPGDIVLGFGEIDKVKTFRNYTIAYFTDGSSEKFDGLVATTEKPKSPWNIYDPNADPTINGRYSGKMMANYPDPTSPESLVEC